MGWVKLHYSDRDFDYWDNLARKTIDLTEAAFLSKDLEHTFTHLGPGLGVYIPNHHIKDNKVTIHYSRYYMAWENDTAINITGHGILYIMGFKYNPYINDADTLYRNVSKW